MADLEGIKTAVIRGKRNEISGLVKAALEEGVDPHVIIKEYMIEAMKEVGARFEANKIFVPEMMIAAAARELAAQADVVVENFKVGGLAKYGLDYASLSALNPRLIYCSITGFGHTGPLRERPGYDFLVQAMGGLMSITGAPDGEPGGGPQKVAA